MAAVLCRCPILNELRLCVVRFHKILIEARGREFLHSYCTFLNSVNVYYRGEVVKRNVDHRMKIGSDIVNSFVFYDHDDDTSKHSIRRCSI